MMKIGDVIRERRKAVGMTLDTLADELGIDVSNMSRKESGKSPITNIELEIIAGMLKTTVSEMYNDVETGRIDTRKAAFIALFEKLDNSGDLNLAFRLPSKPKPKQRKSRRKKKKA